MFTLNDIFTWVDGTSRTYRGHVEDVAQEGKIAAWRALEKGVPHPSGSNPWKGYLCQAARWRMNYVYEHESWLGREKPKGNGNLSQKEQQQMTKVHDPDWLKENPLLVVGEQDDVAIVNSYRDTILAALLQLTDTQKCYIFYRFWEGKVGYELAEAMGAEGNRRGTAKMSEMWLDKIKPALLKSLADLEGVV